FLTHKGKALREESSCLTDSLLENSKLTIPEMIALNEQIQRLRTALNDR
ncbi:MAG: Organic hydroperoxide resistance transcriptional regulator, partial [Sphingomonas bacterium]|nr:Organic hydroperoxide resistance transcriptional regulator [Sphingomonas bacterium]